MYYRTTNAFHAQTSPYPSQPELQASLQEHVDWVSQKQSVVRHALRHNKLAKASVHDARSTNHIPDAAMQNYTVTMAGPLHG